MRLLGFDTETDLIEEGLKAPPLVCYTVSESERRPTLHRWDEWRPLFRLWERAAEGRVQLIGHNVAYDAIVCMAFYDELIPIIFEAYAAGHVECTLLREMLLRLELTGRPGGAPKLDDLTRKYLNKELDKDPDGWRLRFGELRHVPLIDWPTRAVSYALDDADVLEPIYEHQDRRARHDDTFYDSPAQARFHLAFTLMAAWGLKTDVDHVERVEAQLLRLQDERAEFLIHSGIMRPNKEQRKILEAAGVSLAPKGGRPGSVHKASLVDALVAEGNEIQYTDKGNPSLKAEILETYESEIAKTYLAYTSDGKQLSTYLEKYKSGLVQCSVNPLLANGRKSLAKPSLQNLPTSGPVRESFVAREGMVLCSTDYAGIELRTDAQSLLWHFGRSRMAELFQKDPDADLHSLVASRILNISEEEGLARKKAKDPEFKDVRDKQAKRAVFGLGGGMGLDRFDATLRKEGVILPREQLERIKAAYLEAFPEKKRYFQMCGRLVRGGSYDMQCWVSKRWRGHTSYCQLANGYFSSLMTDGSNDAAFQCVRAMYDPTRRSILFGARMVNAVHDEIIAEVFKEGAHEQGHEIARIMCDTMMEHYTPDIPISAEPALMRRWHKGAATVYDEKGRLQVWEPTK